MPFYMVQGKYNPENWAKLVGNPQDRTSPTEDVAAAFGGKLHHVFFAFGDYDVVCIFEMPDQQSALALAMKISASGSSTTIKTTALFTQAEAVAAMAAANRAADAYRPPSA